MRALSLLLASLALTAACSSSDGGSAVPLDCAWLQGENCWKTTVSAAKSCLPPQSEKGVLSADNATCTYASGAVVTFDAPLVLPLGNSPEFNFTLSVGGTPCLRHHETPGGGGFDLTVDGKTVTESVLPGATPGLEIRCPDGTTYANSQALDLLSCDGSFGGLPGNSWSSTPTSVSFGLVNTASAAPSSLPLFDCAK